MKKRVMAIITALLLLVTTGAQFALAVQAQGEPVTEEIQALEVQASGEPEPLSDGQQDEPLVANDYYEFVTAFRNAQDGDTITITGVIEIMTGNDFGDAGKHIILQRGNSDARFIFEFGDVPYREFVDFTFDGANLPSDVPFVTVGHFRKFRNVNFINCIGGNGAAVNVSGAPASFVNCQFDNNTSILYGAHLFIGSGATVTLDGCILTNGYAEMNGGAIQNNATCSITSSTITGNAADGSGGGVSSTGSMTITTSRIYANTAVQGGSDIANGIWGNLTLSDSIETLTSIFDETGFVPVGWIYDYPIAPLSVPGEVEAPQFVPLKMAFEDNAPPTEPAPEHKCPEPEKIIETVYETVYVPEYITEYVTRTEYVYITVPASDITPTPEPTTPPITDNPNTGGDLPGEEVTPPRLVCGDAVIDVLRRDYLLGYVDSQAGQKTPLKRAQAVQILFRLLTDDSLKRVYSETGGFIDVSVDDWVNVFTSTLKNAGGIVGCGGDMFQPERNLTRGEMVTLFTRFTEPRTDQAIQLEHWSADAIKTAASLGWITYDGDFNPDGEVTVQEFINFALTVLEWGNS